MALEDIVNVSITASSQTPTRPGFGTPLFAVNKVPTAFVNRVYSFASLKEITDFGFVSTDPAYLMATKAFSQNPRVKKIKIGRRDLKTVQSVTLKVLDATEGAVYSFTLNGVAVTYTVLASATTTTVATAIELLTEAVTGIDSTSSTDTVTITKATASAAGTLFDLKDWTPNLTIKDASADPGIATDLDAILAFDSDWYGLALDSCSKAEAVAAAAWVEANDKIAVWDTSDSECFDNAVTTDIGKTLKGSNYARSGVMFNANQLRAYASCAWLGNRFPFDPGSDTWKFKTLAGVPTSVMTEGNISNLLAKHINVYTAIAGVSMTQEGITSSGEFFDTVRFIDWLKAEIKVRVFAVLVNNQKIPYTDAGVDIIVSIIKGALQDGITVGGLSNDPAPTVSAPLVKDVNSIDKGNRLLPDVVFTGTLAGAIHAIEISGTLSV
jgi:hypothetical protein